MITSINFSPYTFDDKKACLTIFDENCPRFFAPNERFDYAHFLDSSSTGYEVCILEGVIIGAYGLVGKEQGWRELHWILISPKVQGLGIGSQFVKRIVTIGKTAKLIGIKIAASHLSATFFAKHGATHIREMENGWGIGMHRADMELKL